MSEIMDASIKVISIFITFICLILGSQLLVWQNVKLILRDPSKLVNKKGLCDWVGFWLLTIPVIVYFYPKLFKVSESKLVFWIIGWVTLPAIVIIVILKDSKRYMKK